MTDYTSTEIELINISLGITIKLRRLKKKLSQLDLGIISDTDNTIVGRIERAEHVSGWDKIMQVSQKLNIDYCSLFVFKTKQEVLDMITECLKLETKLTTKKQEFYDKLVMRITELYDKI